MGSHSSHLWPTVLSVWAIVLLSGVSVSTSHAQEHTVEAAESAPPIENPAFELVSQPAPPTPEMPLSAQIVGTTDNWPGWDSYEVTAQMDAIHPLVSTSLLTSIVRADTGTDVVSGTTTLNTATEWVVVRRTDQPAAPGETVQIQLLTEFNVDVQGGYSNDDGGTAGIAVWTIRSFVGPNGSGNPVVSVGLGGANPPSVDVSTGWITRPTPWGTVLLDTPQLLTFRIGTDVDTHVATFPSESGTLDSTVSVQTRLADVPFLFDGPGSYTATAVAIRIVDNRYPENDCNGDEIPDSDQIDGNDCNGNGALDGCDINLGFSDDCNTNGVPDECEPDCNGNSVADECDLTEGTSLDCNGNDAPDECDIASGFSDDCDSSGVPDECETLSGEDCNDNGIDDYCDLLNGPSEDCNLNEIPDECETDCNGNGIPDNCDLSSGASQDCDSNAVPDECDPDCNNNGIPDLCDIVFGGAADCTGNNVPDECELDCNANGIADTCDIQDGSSTDCNANGYPDECDVQGAVYWVGQGAINALLRGTFGQSFTSEGLADLGATAIPRGLAIDIARRHLYWIDADTNTVMRSNLNGKSVVSLVDLGDLASPYQIALDLVNDQIYVSGDRVLRSNLFGNGTELFDLGYTVRGLAVDAQAGTIYWSGYSGPPSRRIMRGDLDFNNAEAVVSPVSATSLALDGDGYLYWTDTTDELVSRVNIETLAHEVLISGAASPVQDLAIDAADGRMYIATQGEALYRANLDGSGLESFTCCFDGYVAVIPRHPDCNIDLRPDECEVDCNDNGFADECDTRPIAFLESFEEYTAGTNLHGQGGWFGWDNNPAAGGMVSNMFSRFGFQSVEVASSSDPVYEFDGVTNGRWDVTAWLYVPGSAVVDTYFILLNTYAPGGPNNWSSQIRFNSNLDIVQSTPDGTVLGTPLSALTDRWIEIRADINLSANTQTTYIDGQLLVTKSWADGEAGGAPTLAAVNLYANGSDAVYYDDIRLQQDVNDFNGNAVPDECENPLSPLFEPLGGRYLRIEIPFEANDPFALRLTSQDHPCLSMWISDQGALWPTPTYQMASDWQGTLVHSQFVVPDSTYELQVDFGLGSFPPAVTATTWRWGDVDDNGAVNFADVLAGVLAYTSGGQGIAEDIAPCETNGSVNFEDVYQIVLAFQGMPFSAVCDVPCP